MKHRKMFYNENHNYLLCLAIHKGNIIYLCAKLNFVLLIKFDFLFFILSFTRYEAKRLEIENWLQRMENRLEQMGKIATTADVLEAQQKEQKVRSKTNANQ